MKLPSSSGPARWITLGVFVAAFLARLAFWQATPDRDWPHSALYKGDAVVWTDFATALNRGQQFELGLPLRPPGNGHLLAWLGVEGRHRAGGVKIVWCLLGALAVMLLFRAARTAFGEALALLVGAWCSFSTALLILSTSLNNETPYLLLVALILGLAPRLASSDAAGPLLAWGALNGQACLLRVEHLLFFALAVGWLVIFGGSTQGAGGMSWRRRARRVAVPAAAFALVLAPWHYAAWRAIDDFNNEPRPLSPAAEAAQASIEKALAGLEWTSQALAARDALPAFARRSASNFVAATVAWRGGRRVTAQDFSILDEAFGVRPRALQPRPFVALYGPLNFYLAQRSGAPVGFDPWGLDRPPLLRGGAERYPQLLLTGLPPAELSFLYPPHVEIVTEGYRLGRAAIALDPVPFARRSLARLEVVWQGARLGWTGWGLPWGIEGVRRAVDLAVPEGTLYRSWGVVLLLLCAGGLWMGRREPLLWVWVLFIVHKLVAGALFYGYARHGATVVPAVALLACLPAARLLSARGATVVSKMTLLVLVAGGLALGLEGWRWARPPQLLLDGRPVRATDPLPLAEHRDRQVTTR